MIPRRTLLQSGAAVALGAPALIGLAQETFTLRFHTQSTALSTVWRTIDQPWMEKIERESGGRIRFQGFPSMQLGGAPAGLFDQARDGVADITWTLTGITAGRFPRAEVFELPFFMAGSAEATSKAFWEYIHTHAPEEFRGVKLLALHVHGPGLFHFRDRAITRPEDLRGQRVRAPTRMVNRLLTHLGATPIGMPAPQVPEALSRGVIDGALFPWEVVPGLRVHELVRNHSEFEVDGGALYTITFARVMNQRRFETLPPDLQRIIDNNSGLAASGQHGRLQQAGDAAARQLALDRGNQINVIRLAQAQEFRRLARQVEVEWIQDMNRRGFNGQNLIASAKRLIEKHSRG